VHVTAAQPVRRGGTVALEARAHLKKNPGRPLFSFFAPFLLRVGAGTPHAAARPHIRRCGFGVSRGRFSPRAAPPHFLRKNR
jgi:hypothetical protein